MTVNMYFYSGLALDDNLEMFHSSLVMKMSFLWKLPTDVYNAISQLFNH